MSNEQQVLEILKPVLYADIFDYPLTFDEIYKFLQVKIAPEQLRSLLKQALDEQVIIQIDEFYCLFNKSHLVAKRQERQEAADMLWPGAIHFGRWIATLPFIRLVAVTGALAVNNPRDGVDDIDYLIVTQPGRLWLCRAIIILLVRYGYRQGVRLCPNYIITENVLEFEDDFFAAREVLQMQPVYGKKFYLKMRELNAWINNYFPHSTELNLDKLNDELSPGQRVLKKSGELLLGGLIGNILEKQLQAIQISKHTRQAVERGARDKVIFTTDICKGHYDNHNHKTMDAYRQRVKNYQNGRNMTSPNGRIKGVGVDYD